jgi:hypothetical protein
LATCPVCSGGAEKSSPFDGGERERVSCSGCGDFIITKMAERVLRDNADKIPLVSYWIRRQCDGGNTPEIDKAKLTKILSERSVPSVLEQADRLLVVLGDERLMTGRPGTILPLTHNRRIAATIGAPPEPGGGLMYLIRELAQNGFLQPAEVNSYGDHVGLTFKGWAPWGTKA